MKVRSKHNNLLNYFIYDERDLSPAYVASCRKFFKEISLKPQAVSVKQSPQLKGIRYYVKENSTRNGPSRTIHQTRIKKINGNKRYHF